MQIQWSLVLVARLRVRRNLGSPQFNRCCAELARNLHRESSLLFDLPTSSHPVNNGLGFGDSLISVVAHEFEMRLLSDQRDAL